MGLSHYFLEDFVSLQRKSFFQLLKTGIPEEFAKRNPITNKQQTLEFVFHGQSYKLLRPRQSLKQSILLGKTYAAKLYVPVQLIDSKNHKIQFKWVFIANLPLMTKRGHFFINGAARVIMNQIVRSPGIYYHKKLHEIYSDKQNSKPDRVYTRYYADFICERGTWLRLEMDREKAIWAQMKKGPKLPILWLLIGMGLTEKMIYGKITDSKLLLANFQRQKKSKIEYSYLTKPTDIWEEFYFLIFGKKLNDREKAIELGRKWLFKKFMNPRTYDLGKTGRFALNKKLNVHLPIQNTTLTAFDVLAATEYLIQLEKGVYGVDDIDHLKNRKIRTAGELIQLQFGIGLLRLEKNIREKMNGVGASWKSPEETQEPFSGQSSHESPASQEEVFRHSSHEELYSQKVGIAQFLNPKAVNGALKEFFGTSPLSQFMDQINPLSEITHKRRLSSLGPGGVTRDTATLAIRGIHPSHYGRICPIETPEGKNTGLVNSLTALARLNDQGILESPFYKVYQGQIQKEDGFIYLSAEQEEKFQVGAGDLNLSPLGFLSPFAIPARVATNFTRLRRRDLQFLAISPLQMISIATSLIPFLEHDDANRALMGSNMQRQAVPLIRPQRPIVGTGLETRVVSDSGHALQAEQSGFVSSVTSHTIILYGRKKQ